MAEEKRLDILQDEIKLLKGELKNSLASVRDYLLNMELPSSEFSTILAALSGDDAVPQKSRGNAIPDKAPDIPDSTIDEEAEEEPEENPDEQDQPSEDEDLLNFEEPENEQETSAELPEESAVEEETLPEDELPAESEETTEELPEEGELEEEEEELPEDELLPEEEETSEELPEASEELSELPLEEAPSMEYDQTTNEINRGIPKVNMLANLINWVSRARQDIGDEQLPAFLEVYGISGHLSPELKEVIIHLADIAKEHPEAATDSEIWSQSMLSLHGILTGGDAPQNPVIPSWVDAADEAELPSDEEIIEIDKAKEKRAQLKLVFPNGNGKNKEFCIDLKPEENGDGAS